MATDSDAGQTPTITYSPALDYARLTSTGPGTATLVFNPDGDVDPVVTNITITASSGDLTAIETFTLTITPPDNPPMITAIEDQSVQAGGSSITVNIMATDSDEGQTPTITYSPVLDYARLTSTGPGTATLVFNPDGDVDPVVTNITITASSGDLTATETFTLTITAPAVDNPPMITAIEDQSVQAGGSSITVNIMATDSDAGQTPTITYSPALDYARLTSTGPGTATLVFNPDGDVDPVVTNITITASSGDLTAIEIFTLTITAPAVDNPPMITAIEDQSVQAGGSSITVNIMATDSDEGQTPSLDYSPELPYATLTPAGEGKANLVFNPDGDVDPVITNITITASSGDLTAIETFTLTITPPDNPPMITAIEDQTVELGESITVAITATDSDEGQTPTITYSPALDYARLTSTGPGTATLVFNPDGDVDPVVTNITITASSGDLTATETFTLTITAPAVDNPPMITAIEDQSVQAGGSSITVNIMATDSDEGQTPTITYSPALDYARLTSTGPGTATLVFNPDGDVDPVVTTITITASSGDLTAIETFTLTITPPDNPPMITAIEDQTVELGESITVAITATDSDEGQTPSLDYSPELPYATLTPTGEGKANLVFNPDADVDPVVTNITITASSGDLTATETFTLTITPPDNPPMITAIEDQSVQAGGSSITVNIMATDPDEGQTPSLDYSPELPYATLTPAGEGKANLVFNPDADVDPVVTNITITASSGDLTAIETFTLTITPPDNPPMITAIEDQSVQAGGSSITVNIMATDPDEGQTPSLDYSPELPYATLTPAGEGKANLVFNPDADVDPVVTNITITASSGDLTATETFTLTITPPDNPPMITAIEDQTVELGESITVAITATDPDEGQTPSLDYSPELPYATLTPTGEGKANLVFNPDADVDPVVTNITITASSGDLTATETFTLTITAPAVDSPPVIESVTPGSLSLAAGASGMVEVRASDSDAGQTPSISVSTQPSIFSITDRGDGTATITFMNPGTFPSGTFPVPIRATSGGITVEFTFMLTLVDARADSPPVIESVTPGSLSLAAGASGMVEVRASDSDAGQTPSISVSTQPSIFSITDRGDGTATITFMNPSTFRAGTYPIPIRATSGGITVEFTFMLTFVDARADSPPVIESVTPGSLSLAAGASGMVEVRASDSDAGQTPSISVSTQPSIFSITDRGDGTATITFMNPGTFPSGTYPIPIRATSGGITVEFTFMLTLVDARADSPPVIESVTPGSLSLAAGASGMVEVRASDSDAGETPSISVSTQPSIFSITDRGDGTATITFMNPGTFPSGTYPIPIRATSGGITVETNFMLTLVDARADSPPVIESVTPGSLSLAAGASGMVEVRASDSDAGETPSISVFTQSSIFSITDRGDGTATITFTNPGNFPPETFPVPIRATSGGITVETNFMLTFLPDNPPTITLTPPLTGVQTVQLGGSLTVSITATDPDGQTPLIVISPEPNEDFDFVRSMPTGPDTVELVFTADRNFFSSRTLPENFPITISAISGGITTTIRLDISIAPPNTD